MKRRKAGYKLVCIQYDPNFSLEKLKLWEALAFQLWYHPMKLPFLYHHFLYHFLKLNFIIFALWNVPNFLGQMYNFGIFFFNVKMWKHSGQRNLKADWLQLFLIWVRWSRLMVSSSVILLFVSLPFFAPSPWSSSCVFPSFSPGRRGWRSIVRAGHFSKHKEDLT